MSFLTVANTRVLFQALDFVHAVCRREISFTTMLSGWLLMEDVL